MATNINWFVIWVPSKEAELSEKLRSRSQSKTPHREEVVTEDGGDGLDEEEEGIKEDAGNGKFAVTKVEEEAVTPDLAESRPDDVPLEKGDHKKSDEEEGAALIEETETREKPSEMTVTDKSEVFLEWESLEDIVRRVITQREISSLHVVSSTDGRQTQFSFCVPFDQVEDLLLELQNNGLGQLDHTSLSVFPSSIHVSDNTMKKPEKSESVIEDKMDKFYSSIKSRLEV